MPPDCVHRWRLASATEGCHTVTGTCSLCGETKEFVHHDPANETMWRMRSGGVYLPEKLRPTKKVPA